MGCPVLQENALNVHSVN